MSAALPVAIALTLAAAAIFGAYLVREIRRSGRVPMPAAAVQRPVAEPKPDDFTLWGEEMEEPQ